MTFSLAQKQILWFTSANLTHGDIKEVAKFSSPNRTKREQYDTLLGEGDTDRLL